MGGVISPLLANILLHEVLDVWFEEVVKPLLKGGAFLIRFADDFVIGFAREEDAHRVQDVLPKRIGKYGLSIHPEKTRLVDFRRPRRQPPSGPPAGGSRPGVFDLLGFTHFWSKSLRGNWVVKRKTASKRLSRGIQTIYDWCRLNRHRTVREQHAQLCAKLNGHYQYYGLTGNWDCLKGFLRATERGWRKWLHRRSQRRKMVWKRFHRLLKRYPLPSPKITHSSRRRVANPCT